MRKLCLCHIHSNAFICRGVTAVPYRCFMAVFVFFLSFTFNLAAVNHNETASWALRKQYVECVSHRGPKSFHKILFTVSHRLLKEPRDLLLKVSPVWIFSGLVSANGAKKKKQLLFVDKMAFLTMMVCVWLHKSLAATAD